MHIRSGEKAAVGRWARWGTGAAEAGKAATGVVQVTADKFLKREVALENDAKWLLNNRVEDGTRWLQERREVQNELTWVYSKGLFTAWGAHFCNEDIILWEKRTRRATCISRAHLREKSKWEKLCREHYCLHNA